MTFGEFAGVGRDARPFAAYPSGPMGQDWTPRGVALGGEATLAECQLIYATSQDHSPGPAKLFRDELLRKRHATQNNALFRQRSAVEPSVGFIWSRLSSIGSLAVPGANLPAFGTNVPACTLSFNSIDSAIGRAGLRVGTSFQNGNLALQPFVAASVWDEFASNTKSTFTPTGSGFAGSGFSLDVDSSRVGVFGQFGAGVAGRLVNTGWLGYVRADYRTGDNITGWDVTGGIRYEFSFAAPSAAPIVTK
jgi:hypothetical protein